MSLKRNSVLSSVTDQGQSRLCQGKRTVQAAIRGHVEVAFKVLCHLKWATQNYGHLHYHLFLTISINAAPYVKPPPKAHNPTLPSTSFFSNNSDNAMGMLLEDVLPISEIFE